jgi:cytoskeletal protein CcmA (bactofilin family)
MTHIGVSVVIDGELTSEEDVRIDGRLKGHVHVRGATLTVGESATLEADIRGTRVVVHGTVQGSIAANERIELGPTANVSGSVTAERVVMADGARFNGGIDMGHRTIVTKVAQYKASQAAARA